MNRKLFRTTFCNKVKLFKTTFCKNYEIYNINEIIIRAYVECYFGIFNKDVLEIAKESMGIPLVNEDHLV